MTLVMASCSPFVKNFTRQDRSYTVGDACMPAPPIDRPLARRCAEAGRSIGAVHDKSAPTIWPVLAVKAHYECAGGRLQLQVDQCSPDTNKRRCDIFAVYSMMGDSANLALADVYHQ